MAENGIEAVSMASHIRPDVIVMDVNMPGMNGIEATKHIKAAQPAILVIGFSVNDDPHVQAAIREAGADAFLTKGPRPRNYATPSRHWLTNAG
jgi:CheY-like chemotaxis protein